jgi:hypothetical protein
MGREATASTSERGMSRRLSGSFSLALSGVSADDSQGSGMLIILMYFFFDRF